MKNLNSAAAPPSTIISSLVCAVGNKEIQTHGVFRIISEDESTITIDLNGRVTSVDRDTMSLNTGSEGLVRFGRHVLFTESNLIAVSNTGDVNISNAENTDPEKKVRVFSINGARVQLDDVSLTFNAKGFLSGDGDVVQLSQKHTTGFYSCSKKGDILIAVSDSIAMSIISTVLSQDKSNLEDLTVELRESLVESINKHFPNKNGYLNDINIESLASKLFEGSGFQGLAESKLIALIGIVVNNYDRYVRLYNSRRSSELAIQM